MMMNARTRPAIALVAAIAIVCLTAGFDTVPRPRSTARMDRCTALLGQFYRYDGVMSGGAYHGEVASAVLAHYRCQQGHYRVPVHELEVLLRDNLVPLPAVGATMQAEVDDED